MCGCTKHIFALEPVIQYFQEGSSRSFGRHTRPRLIPRCGVSTSTNRTENRFGSFNISRVVPSGWVALQFEGGSPQSRPNFYWVRPHGLESGLSFSIASTFPSQDFATLSAFFPGALVEPWGNWCQVCALRDCPPICMLSASLCMHVCLLVRHLGPSTFCASSARTASPGDRVCLMLMG
jgi:hypothetical protein